MQDNPSSQSLPPSLRQIALTFRIAGWIDFWIQLVLATISTLIFVFASISFGSNVNTGSSGTQGGIFFASCGLLVLFFSIYQALRYTRMAKRLQEPNPNLRPKKAETIKMVQTGLIVSLAGMFLSLLGAEAITGTLLAKSLSQPQGIPFSTQAINGLIQPLDIFVVLANTHTITAHFAGIVSGLWLLNRLNRA